MHVLDFLVIGSVACGVAMLFMGRRPKMVADAARIVSIGLALLSLSLLWHAGDQPALTWHYLPDGEPARLILSSLGRYLVICAFLALAVGQMGLAASHHNASRFWQPGLAYLLCGLVVVALTVDQFLARYIVLDLAALGTLAFLALGRSRSGKGFRLLSRLMQFRLGDSGLMLMILLLYRASGTFHIDTMLDQIVTLPSVERVLVVGGGLLAVWVKMGLPPFQGWLADSEALSWPERLLIIGLGLPLLGGYLLYRLGPPLVAANGRAVLVVLGVLVLGWSLLQLLWNKSKLTWLLAGHSAIGLLLAGTPWMQFFLLTFFLRLVVLAFWSRQPRLAAIPRVNRGRRFPLPIPLPSAPPEPIMEPANASRASVTDPLVANPGGRSAAGVDASAERDREYSDGGLIGTLLSAARYVAAYVEQGAIQDIEGGLVKALLSASRCAANWVEQGVLGKAEHLLVDLVHRVGRWLQAGHTGRLRLYLLWASAGVVVLLIATVAVHGW